MKPDISEYSYGFAVVDNLATGAGLPITAAPILPSLRAEGQTGGGYDVQLQLNGRPLFLQFKISDIMVGGRAAEARQLGLPYHRIHLRTPPSRQHALLLELEQTSPLVYYVAPDFATTAELNQYYLNRQVIQRSRFIKPSLIGDLPDDKEHSVSFSPGNAPLFRSTPRTLESRCDSETFLSEVVAEIGLGREEPHVRERMAHLKEAMIRIVRETPVRRPRRPPQPREETGTLPLAFEIADAVSIDATIEGDRHALAEALEEIRELPPLAAVQQMAHTFFGCEVVSAQLKEESKTGSE